MADVELSRSETETFIYLLRQQTGLWSIQSPDYHRREKRHQSLWIIGYEMGKGWTEQQVNKKIGLLRSYYSKELAKVKKLVSGQSSESVYKSSWQYFDLLDSFLRDNTVPRRSSSNLSTSTCRPAAVESDEIDDGATTDVPLEGDILKLVNQCGDSGPSQPTHKRATPKSCQPVDITTSAMNYLQALTEQKNKKRERSFGIYISVKLDEIKNPKKRAKLELEIHTLVSSALIEEMDEAEIVPIL